ncbi:DUF4142 domain-containing protein [Flavobacterium hungaricum]|uniref:DUF4142 domain-containing protein n=1 Tax=Flavobacterium hungaricum TaxID=2082725 RepID=A0ABR9TEC7_9FLAO|nr:DUF4142 domain-containing protein [Flavobacterium hungaricum]MBE8723704.1 DUF4142 domain-containing protein [Flavobacterium hungaricum]
MKAISPFKGSFFKVFLLSAALLCMSSCRKIKPIESSFKNETFAINDREESEVFFFISTSNISKGIISKSKIAQEKSSDVTIKELSKKIEMQEDQLLNEISKIATTKLIVVTEINATHKRDLYNLIDASGEEFNAEYLSSIKESLTDQIELLESISNETNDKTILQLVLFFLPQQYKLLRETESLQKQNI